MVNPAPINNRGFNRLIRLRQLLYPVFAARRACSASNNSLTAVINAENSFSAEARRGAIDPAHAPFPISRADPFVAHNELL